VSERAAALVTLHVWRVRRRALPRALWRMAVDGRRLWGTPGVAFAKLLGTGRDRRFGPTDADPTRWAALVAWDDGAGAAGFDAGPVGHRWRAIATAACRLTLRPLGSRGTWSGANPFAGTPERADRPLLVLTRARLRPARAATFWRRIPAVGATLPGAPGLIAAFGIGEAPIGWQGTVSVWRSGTDAVRFAYRQPEHAAAVAATPVLRWYAEELFARFAVLDVVGDRDVLGWQP
jgi:hypothetical protein